MNNNPRGDIVHEFYQNDIEDERKALALKQQSRSRAKQTEDLRESIAIFAQKQASTIDGIGRKWRKDGEKRAARSREKKEAMSCTYTRSAARLGSDRAAGGTPSQKGVTRGGRRKG